MSKFKNPSPLLGAFSVVNVIKGSGTIGEPLIGLLGDYHNQLGIDEDTHISQLSTPDFEIEGDVDLPANGILTADVTLVISLDNGIGGTWDTTILIEQSETATNTGVNDLLIDIENIRNEFKEEILSFLDKI